MLSNSCRYAIRAVIYLASKEKEKSLTGIRQISKDLDLPSPFLAKILQQLARKKILKSVKGPHGGFILLKDPSEITLLDIVNIIDGEEIFTDCLIHEGSCRSVNHMKKPCPVHFGYSAIRKSIMDFFSTNTIEEIIKKMKYPGSAAI